MVQEAGHPLSRRQLGMAIYSGTSVMFTSWKVNINMWFILSRNHSFTSSQTFVLGMDNDSHSLLVSIDVFEANVRNCWPFHIWGRSTWWDNVLLLFVLDAPSSIPSIIYAGLLCSRCKDCVPISILNAHSPLWVVVGWNFQEPVGILHFFQGVSEHILEQLPLSLSTNLFSSIFRCLVLNMWKTCAV